MEPIRFSKLSGSGNDFILIDNRDNIISPEKALTFVQAISRRGMSVGADGVILIENDPQGQCDFAWRFYNADGSEPDMCGNGGRCAARYAHKQGIAGTSMSFRTLAGVIRAEITGERTVKLQLTPPVDYQPSVQILADGRPYDLMFLNTGVPHSVLQVEDVEAYNLKTLGPLIRHHERFAPEGVNLNLVQVAGQSALFIRTYERGVEDETLACGTGAVAAAITMTLAGKVSPPVILTTRSRERLTVYFENDHQVPTHVYFEGAVAWVYDGRLLPESLL